MESVYKKQLDSFMGRAPIATHFFYGKFSVRSYSSVTNGYINIYINHIPFLYYKNSCIRVKVSKTKEKDLYVIMKHLYQRRF